jgi:hypothetical protein
MLRSQGIREGIVGIVILAMYLLHWASYRNSRHEFRKGLATATIGGGLGFAFCGLLDYWATGVSNRRLLISAISLCLLGVAMLVLARQQLAAKGRYERHLDG